MKKLIMTLAAAAMITAVSAQDNNQGNRQRRNMDPKEMMERRVNSMKERYNLTDEQVEKVKALNEKYMGQWGRGGQRGEGRPNAEGGQQARPERPQGQRPEGGQRGNGGPRRQGGFGFDMTKYNEELKGIMTAEQYKAYEDDAAKQRAEREARMQQRGQRQ